MRKYLRTGLVLVTLAMALLFVHFGPSEKRRILQIRFLAHGRWTRPNP